MKIMDLIQKDICRCITLRHLASHHLEWEARSEPNSPALTLGVTALQPEQSFRDRQAVAGGLPTSEKLHFNAHSEMGLYVVANNGRTEEMGTIRFQLLPCPTTATGVGRRNKA